MRIRVIKVFRDKYDLQRFYQPGEVIDFPGDRAANILALELGEPEELQMAEDVAKDVPALDSSALGFSVSNEQPAPSDESTISENIESESLDNGVKPKVRRPRKNG